MIQSGILTKYSILSHLNFLFEVVRADALALLLLNYWDVCGHLISSI